MLTSVPQWVALYTNPRAEKKVDQNLRAAGIESYLPIRRELHNWSDRKKWVESPLIKSYTFARITKLQLSTVRAINGVSHVVSFQGEIAVVPDNEIQMLKDFLAAEVEVQVRNIEQLKRGERVRISSGTFAGREGMLVSDCDDGNFAVEISGISMAMIVHIDVDLLEPLLDQPNNQVRRHKKYTIR